jgi:hypothetical protein
MLVDQARTNPLSAHGLHISMSLEETVLRTTVGCREIGRLRCISPFHPAAA